MNLRTAQRADLPRIVEIYNQAVLTHSTADLDPVSVEEREGWFAAHPAERRPIWVAELESEVAGWCSLSDYRPGRAAVRHAAEISYYVDSGHRRRGVARALVRAALDACPALDVDCVFAIVLEDNTASLTLLEGFGFSEWGHLPDVASFDGRRVGHRYWGRHLTP
jgi:L-amino acid N-acyltransferase YncA